MRRLFSTWHVLLMAIFVLVYASMPRQVHALVLPCTAQQSVTTGNICIVELQTRGTGGNEDEDFVIIANPTAQPITLSSVQLQYINSNGVMDVAIPASTSGSTTLGAGQMKAFVSDALTTINSTAAKLSTTTNKLSMASSGGTLQIAKVLSSATTVYDRVGWGSAQVSETGAAPVHTTAASLMRKQGATGIQDTNDNAQDFTMADYACRGATISEIQPYVTDDAGRAIDAWVEFRGTSDADGDCSLVTASNDTYTIPVSSLPAVNELVVITRGTDNQGNMVPLHLGERTGQIWLTAESHFSGAVVRVPYETQSYSNVVKGQSWSFVDGAWHRTYQPTPGAENVYVVTLLGNNNDPNACQSIKVTELLANPTGEDTNNEWVELYNESDQVASLARCQLSVAGTTYNFLPDDVLSPREWRTVTSLYSSDGDDKPLSLRNSGDTLVALQKLENDGTATTLQSFIYTDAPEGQSYARFDNGWSWTFTVTPNAPNILLLTLPTPNVSEFPISNNPSSSGSDNQPSANTPATVRITELMPNPALPATDENDEYVELVNDGSEPIDLYGYKLQTGSNYSYSYTFGHEFIDPGQYKTFYAKDTSLSLSNTAGRARLLSATGNTISETDPYDKANEGMSWTFVDGKWQWSSTPTPNASNVLTAAMVFPTTKSSAKTTKATSTTTKPKSSSASTAKAAAVKKASTKGVSTTAGASENVDPPSSLHPAILAGVGGITVAYGLYEYRHDVANRIHQFRSNRAARRASRGKS